MTGGGFERLLAVRDRLADVAVEMDAERGRFRALAARHDDGTAPRAVSGFNLFQTPRPIAAAMADLVRPWATRPGARILEPSAGLGRLVEPFAGSSAAWVLVEEAEECAAALRAMLRRDVRRGDFLATTTADLGGAFDCVVMNPPFKQGRDIQHIRHAAAMLRPGGRLVSLCYDGPRQAAELRPMTSEWRTLPAGSFRAEGTDAGVCLLVIDAPGGRP